MNKTFLIGNLTRDPELSTTPNGTSLCKFSIAVSRRFTDAEGNRETDFFNIVAWRGLAENCEKYLTKGKKVAVFGQLQNRTWEQDGQKRYATDIVADEIEFLSPKTGNEQHGANGDELEPLTDEKLPF